MQSLIPATKEKIDTQQLLGGDERRGEERRGEERRGNKKKEKREKRRRRRKQDSDKKLKCLSKV